MNADPPRIRTEVQVMFFDTDCGGVVSNIAYLRFVEIGRTLLAEELGLPVAEMAHTQKYPVVVKTEIDYRRVAKLGDRLVVEGWLDDMPALAAEAKLAAALAAGRREDAQSGGAAIGPHRSDLGVAVANGTAAGLASTGEQKALLISIVLAQARLCRAIRGEAPLLLLDEVAAHLDAGRRAALLAALVELEGQAWVTGTDAALFAALRGRARFLSVAAGTLSPTVF